MLTSSIKTQIFSVGLAPKSVFPFLISLLSIASCTSLALVCAEKLRKIVETPFLYLRSERSFPTRTDFPTPDSPVRITGFSISIISSITLEYLIVSIVGTSKSKNWAYLSKVNSGTLVAQEMKLCWVYGLIILSKIHSVLGNVKSGKDDSMIDWIYGLWVNDIPPPKPQIIL